MTDVLEDVDLDAIVSVEERPHVACCVADVFLCGAPFHPELVASPDTPEDECCETCVDIMYALLCPPWRPTHQHCVRGVRICPP